MALSGRAVLVDAWKQLCLVKREVGNNGYLQNLTVLVKIKSCWLASKSKYCSSALEFLEPISKVTGSGDGIV